MGTRARGGGAARGAATIDDVARAAGVSRSSVSKAFGSKGFASLETRDKVLRAAARLNYRPSYFARSLSLGTTGLIGVVTTPSLLTVFNDFVQPIARAIRASGYSLLLYTSSGDPDSERLCLEDLVQKRVEGVIVIPSSNPAAMRTYRDVAAHGIKLVVVDRCMEGLKVPQVGGDDYEAGRLATEHLVSLGHRRIVHLAIPSTSSSGRRRVQGFRDAMARAGIPVEDSSIVETGFGEEAGARAMEQLMRRAALPTGVIARHDLNAIGAMRAALAAGLSVPWDVSIVGNADISLADMVRVPLTTVRHPNWRMAELGVTWLLDLLAGKRVAPEITRLPVELVVRSSSAPPRAHPARRAR
jgi:LacI family transcriptional regulator